jgi:hypothetical protein
MKASKGQYQYISQKLERIDMNMRQKLTMPFGIVLGRVKERK